MLIVVRYYRMKLFITYSAKKKVHMKSTFSAFKCIETKPANNKHIVSVLKCIDGNQSRVEKNESRDKNGDNLNTEILTPCLFFFIYFLIFLSRSQHAFKSVKYSISISVCATYIVAHSESCRKPIHITCTRCNSVA